MRPPARGRGRTSAPRCAGCATPASRWSSAPAPTSARCARSRRRCGRCVGWYGRRVARAQAAAVLGGGRPRRWTWPREAGPVFRADAGHAVPRRVPPVRRRLPGLGARAAARPSAAAAARPRDPARRLTVPAEPALPASVTRGLTLVMPTDRPATPSSSPPPGPRSAAPPRDRCATLRPDDLAATIVRAALDKVPAARPARHRRPLPRLRPARRRAGLQHGPGGRHPARATTTCPAPR